ncbi:UNVERIFIED_CONTAM: Subtilisin-like protease SBT1.2 [Sesamum angustifolium]|uniref:Subtilisin-like protease SBT1.2 n=1 Tax=Sesamum angustifolium TaxID=2727405 RepID=A0AAW2MMH1_9LAMI
MGFLPFLTFICMLNFYLFQTFASDGSTLETYIVHVDGPDGVLNQLDDLDSWYKTFLSTITVASGERNRMIYSYRHVFKGFAARLSADEVKAMEDLPGFVSARPERKLSLHTTHSPNFLGLNQNMGFWNESNYGKGVIIGVLDTGIFPDHPSFSDEGMPPPPAKWKGRCDFNVTTKCNNKIIGARYFNSFDDSPLDDEGHGTHTASTAAGNFVRGANVFGNANGTAVGIAPLAHLAIYKVCSLFCSESSIIAAMDTAIDDGVDILSLSLGGFANSFYDDSIALGAYSAMEQGILLVLVLLTENKSDCRSWKQPNIRWRVDLSTNGFPTNIVAPCFAGMLNTSDPDIPYCTAESLNGTNLRGKIVVCEIGITTRISKGQAVKDAGGAAMILVNPARYANMTLSESHVLPATHVSYADGLKIKAYIKLNIHTHGHNVFKGTIIGDDRAPVVAAFSSRGPNWVSRNILKPDILGPGVNILAAWPVSWSCSAAQKLAPDWSPAAIKSAIMTTADVVNLAHNPIEDERFLPANIFATGSGHVNPSRANDPGFVYDVQPEDYIPYLCGLNYTNRQVGTILQRKDSNKRRRAKFILRCRDRPPPGIDVVVEPSKLDFLEVNQKLQYQVTFSQLNSTTNSGFVQGYLKWNSSWRSVRSPIAVLLR